MSLTVTKRTVRDVTIAAQGEEMRSLDMYYSYEDIDITTGTGLLFGPEGTPYAFCPLLFSVKIPADYPFTPPQVLILTSDAVTRFHPNLYVGGKVCLSILGTYPGPKWSSMMNIGTVFKSILSILDENPITNEPGWEKFSLEDSKARDYAEWVEFNLLKLTVHEYRSFLLGTNHNWNTFKEVFESEEWKEKWSKIGEKLKVRLEKGDKVYLGIPYGMSGMTKWQTLLKEFQTTSEMLSSIKTNL